MSSLIRAEAPTANGARNGTADSEPGKRQKRREPKRADGKLANRLAARPTDTPFETVTAPALDSNARITEDDVKRAVSGHLESEGYQVKVMWGKLRGIDIEARRGRELLIIEAKAEVFGPRKDQQQGSYFLQALGELVQRMNDPNATFGLALPDNRRYRGLVARLPTVAMQRLQLAIHFAKRVGEDLHVSVKEPPDGLTQV